MHISREPGFQHGMIGWLVGQHQRTARLIRLVWLRAVHCVRTEKYESTRGNFQQHLLRFVKVIRTGKETAQL